MADRAIRMIKILSYIPELPKKTSTKSIMEKLSAQGVSVSMRTIQRDLVELSKHFPLVCDDNNPSGWSFIEGPKAEILSKISHGDIL